MDKVNEESILLTKQNYFARTNKIKQWLEVSNELIEKYDDVGSKIVVANYHRKNRNYKEAIKYYSLIAKDNIKYYSFCLEKICECFYHLRGYKSFKETLDILKNEDIDAYYYCSLNYLYLVTKEYDKAKNLIKKVVNSKRKRRNEIICTYIGFLYKDKNYKEAKKYLLLLEKEGIKLIYDILAKYYYEGLGGIKKDINKAIFYSLCANTSASNYRLGMIFTDDKTAEHDHDLAIHYLLRALQLNNEKAVIALAFIYDDKNSKYYSPKRRDECLECFFKTTKYNEKVQDQISSLLDSFSEEKRKKFEDLMDKYWNRKAMQA